MTWKSPYHFTASKWPYFIAHSEKFTLARERHIWWHCNRKCNILPCRIGKAGVWGLDKKSGWKNVKKFLGFLKIIIFSAYTDNFRKAMADSPTVPVLTPLIILKTKSCDKLLSFSSLIFAIFSDRIFLLTCATFVNWTRLSGGSNRPLGARPCSRQVKNGSKEPDVNESGGNCNPSCPIKTTVPVWPAGKQDFGVRNREIDFK